MNWENLLKRNIAVSTGRTKTVDIPLIEDDENCKVRYDALIEKMKDFFSNIDTTPFASSNFVNTYSFRSEPERRAKRDVIYDDDVYCVMLEWFKFIRDWLFKSGPSYFRTYRETWWNQKFNNLWEKHPDMRFVTRLIKVDSGMINKERTAIELTVFLEIYQRINKVVIDFDLWEKFIEFLRGAL